MIKHLIDKIRSRKFFVILDDADNSVTLSQAVFTHMKKNNEADKGVNIFVFKEGDNYAFMVNPEIEQETQLCPLQYNGEHQTIGFQTLCPSVARIAYDYHLPIGRPAKLKITTHTTITNKTYYRICRRP